MTIGLIVEGRTEKAFLPHLRGFLKKCAPSGSLPRLSSHVCDGRISTGQKLRRVVERLLVDQDASAARKKMHERVGEDHKFYPHAAQHDSEAWLLPERRF